MAVLNQPTSVRKLAAILSADIAAYSALMGADEEGTVRKLREVREAVLPIIEKFGGRIIDLAGDGILAEFRVPCVLWKAPPPYRDAWRSLTPNANPPCSSGLG
jgi:class 3 adenylate cyclase